MAHNSRNGANGRCEEMMQLMTATGSVIKKKGGCSNQPQTAISLACPFITVTLNRGSQMGRNGGGRGWRKPLEGGRGKARHALPKSPGLSSGCVCTLTPRPHGPANLRARRKPLEGGGEVHGWDSISPCTHSTRYSLIPSAQPFPIAFHRLSSPQNGGKQKRWELHCLVHFYILLLTHTHTSPQDWSLKLLEQALFSISNPSFIILVLFQFLSSEVMSYSLHLVYFTVTVLANDISK